MHNIKLKMFCKMYLHIPTLTNIHTKRCIIELHTYRLTAYKTYFHENTYNIKQFS